MLQPCPMDDAVRLLKPILSAETWVSNTLQLRLVDKKLLTTVFFSLSAVLDHVWPSAIGLGLCSVLSGLLMLLLWRLSFTFPGTKFSKTPGKLLFDQWNVRFYSQYRSCECFFTILCVLPCRYYLKCYIFVSRLEALNIPYTVQSFLSSPKEGLVKGLWKNHSHEPQVNRNVTSLLGL